MFYNRIREWKTEVNTLFRKQVDLNAHRPSRKPIMIGAVFEQQNHGE